MRRSSSHHSVSCFHQCTGTGSDNEMLDPKNETHQGWQISKQHNRFLDAQNENNPKSINHRGERRKGRHSWRLFRGHRFRVLLVYVQLHLAFVVFYTNFSKRFLTNLYFHWIFSEYFSQYSYCHFFSFSLFFFARAQCRDGNFFLVSNIFDVNICLDARGGIGTTTAQRLNPSTSGQGGISNWSLDSLESHCSYYRTAPANGAVR